MDPQNNNSQIQSAESHLESSDGNEINLLDLAIIFAKYKFIILGLPLITAIFAAAYSLTLTFIYTATAKILPPQQGQSSASQMLGQLGGLAGLAGLGGLVKNPSDLYASIMKSRTVADRIIQRFDLNTYYKETIPTNTRGALEGATLIRVEKDGMILISVDDVDPKRAADLANAYVEELNKLTNVLAVTEASQRRLFFERQLEQAKDNLMKTEVLAKQALQQGGVMQVEGQGRAMIEASARLRAQIAVKEVQLGTMRAFGTDQNPDLVIIRQEIQSLKHELGKIEGVESGNAGGKISGGSGRGLDSLVLLRNVKYYETMYELLARQYELARLDEAKNSALVQVLDEAIPPDYRSKPSRTRFVIVFALIALLIALLFSYGREYLASLKKDPTQAERIRTLVGYLRIGKKHA